MRNALVVLALVAMGCSSQAIPNPAPSTDHRLALDFDIQITNYPDIAGFTSASTMDTAALVSVTNRTASTVRLRQLTVETTNDAPASLKMSRPLAITIAPGETAKFKIWGTSNTSDLAWFASNTPPAKIQAVLDATTDNKEFREIFNRIVR
jgi:hypothetical protein